MISLRAARRLAPEVADAGGQVHGQVGALGQQLAHPGEVLAPTGQVGADEGRGRVVPHERLERGHQLAVARQAAACPRRPRRAPQLLEPLVAAVGRLEVGDRVAGVDQHRDARVGGGPPQPGEPGIAGQHQVTGAVPHRAAEVLPHLQAVGAPVDGLRELPGQVLEAVLRAGRPVDVAERGEAAGMGAVVAVEVLVQLGAPPPVEVDHGADVAAVHIPQQRVDIGRHPRSLGREPAAEVVVDVDGPEAGGGALIHGQIQRRPGLVARQPRLDRPRSMQGARGGSAGQLFHAGAHRHRQEHCPSPALGASVDRACRFGQAGGRRGRWAPDWPATGSALGDSPLAGWAVIETRPDLTRREDPPP